LGATAELSEAGYQHVMSAGSDADLTAFATRFLESETLSVEEANLPDDWVHYLRESIIGTTFTEFKSRMLTMLVGASQKKEAHAARGWHKAWQKKAPAAKAWQKKEARTVPQKKEARKLVAANETSAKRHTCPEGFTDSPKDLRGSSGMKTTAHDEVHCAETCCERQGCTSFEFGESTKYAGCWTYTGGDADLAFKDQASDWVSCVKNVDPAACAAYACPHGFEFSTKNLQGSSGLKEETFDVKTCRDTCCEREGCTSFEVGPTTKYSGCWTYTDGAADIKFGDQLANWTSCVRKADDPASPTCPNKTVSTTGAAAPATTTAPLPTGPPTTPFPKAPLPASATGDPHLMNTRGEKFDIYKSGQMEFLRVPYGCVPDGENHCGANFTVHATIQGVSESYDCGQSHYITSLRFGGAWLKDHPLEVQMKSGEMVVLLQGGRVTPSFKRRTITNEVQVYMPDEYQVHVGAGETWIDVSRDLQPVHFFLNLQARSLGKFGCRIGGLLGDDDHAAVSKPPAGCSKSSMLLAKKSDKHQRRFHASARIGV